MERAEDFINKYENFLLSQDNPMVTEDVRDLDRSIPFDYTLLVLIFFQILELEYNNLLIE